MEQCFRRFDVLRAVGAGALAAFFVLGLVAAPSAHAAALTSLSDAVSNHTAGEGSDHAIRFTTPTGVDASSDTITLTFDSAFDLSGIGFGDMDLSHGATGSETSETLAATAAAGVWGASVAGSVITLTAPTDAGAGEITAGDVIQILIGQNASGGTNRITNPSTALDYPLSIAGTFGDTGQIGLAVAESGSVSVGGTVPAPGATTTTTTTTPGGGGGLPGDITPPVIFQVEVTPDGPTSAVVTWLTNEPADSTVRFGHGLGYASGTVSDPATVTEHRIRLTNLVPCAIYHLVAQSTDLSGNTATSGDVAFTMPCDVTPPTITNVRVVNITDTTAVVLWGTDEPASSMVEYGLTDAYGNTVSVPGFVTGHVVPLSRLAPGTTYHLRAISSDPSGNAMTSGDLTFTTLGDLTPPANPALTATPGNQFIRLNWTPSSEADFAGVRLVRGDGHFPAGPNDGTVIYEGTGTLFTDTGLTNGVRYFYGLYAYDASGNVSSGSLASAVPGAAPFPPEIGVTTTPPTPGATIRVELYGADGVFPLLPAADGSVGALAGSVLLVGAPPEGMNGTPEIVAFVLDNATIRLVQDPQTGTYVGLVLVPSEPGRYVARGQAVFTDGRVAETTFILNVQGPGRVFERPLFGGRTVPIPNALVRLFARDGSFWAPWEAGAYGQKNPVTTDAAGQFAFQVPVGRYYAEVRKEGYWAYFGPPLFVDGNVFGPDIELIRLPPTFAEVISPTSTPLENVVAVVRTVGEKLEYGLKRLRAFLGTPAVQQALLLTAAWILAFALLNALSAISLWNALALAQLIALWPLFLLGKRRKEMGIVFNAFTKQPVDLALVRLIHAPTGLFVRSVITDRHGRYRLRVSKPGTYMIKVVKPGYEFPSEFLHRAEEDGKFKGLYYGTRTKITARGVWAPSIGLDPVVAEETLAQARRRFRLLGIQRRVASGGVTMGTALFAFVPTALMAVFTGLEWAAYLLYRRLQVLKAPSRLATVYDEVTGKPLAGALVRLREMSTRTLLQTTITDRHGRYGFVVGQNRYSIEVEASKHQSIELVDLVPVEGEEVIARDVAMIPTQRRRR